MREIIYLLDTNVLIEAARRYYSFDIAPAFWTALLYYAEKGNLHSIDKVKDELKKGKDELAKWAEKEFNSYFHSTEKESIINNYKKIIQSIEDNQQYNKPAKEEFYKFENADPWLVAFAMSLPEKYVIVTQEVFNRDVKNKIPIPNLCESMNIEYLDTFQMLRYLNFKFK